VKGEDVLGPILRGKVVSLEPVRAADVPLINRWWAIPDVIRYWGGIGVPSQAQTEEWWERSARSESGIIWAIRVADRTIGHAFLSIDWSNRSATSGMLLGEVDAWGKGYAGEVVRLRTRYAFEDLGLERLESESVEGNVAMHRALERSGYRRIGRKHGAMVRGGERHASYLFQLLREEWEGPDFRYTTDIET